MGACQHPRMDDIAVGRGFRALRRRRGWTQRELAVRAQIDASVVSDLEAGQLELLRLPTTRRIGRALGITIELAPRWPVADVARLLDAGHARLTERVVGMLRGAGWEVVVEYTFNDYGDRGSVDVLAWHAAKRTLLLVEIKTRLVDVQDLHATFDRKLRIVPKLVARERGWRAAVIGRILVVADTHGNRDVPRRHRGTFETRFPARSRAARRWIRDPVGDLAAVWFLPDRVVPAR